MDKKIICVAVILLIILAIAFSVFTLISNIKKTKPIEPTNDIVVDTSETEKEFEDFEIEVPEGYIVISGDNVENATSMYAKAVAYNFDQEDNRTYMNVYLQNRGDSDFYKDAICVITLYDEEGYFLLRASGVIEEDLDIPVGGTTVVRIQFVGDPGNPARATIEFENNNNTEANIIEEPSGEEAL